jgi:hypothetical protein
MDFSVLLVGETRSAAPLGFARAELCNRYASRLTSQVIDYIAISGELRPAALGMNCRSGKNCR